MNSLATQNRQNKFFAGLSTLMLMLLLLILFFFFKLHSPIPPFEGSGDPGIEVNFGFSDDGMGDVLTEFTPVSENKNANPTSENNPDDANSHLTSDDADAVSIPKEKNIKPKNKNTTPKETEPSPDQNLEDAFKNFSDKSGSDGITGKPGNQGKPDGTNNTNNYNGDGPGGGGPGGPGKGGGKNYKFNLKGRIMKAPPEKISDFNEEAILVVDIVVDKKGKVVFAEVNRAKSVNPNYILSAKARQAALTTKFNESPDGSFEQKGTITFEFKLK